MIDCIRADYGYTDEYIISKTIKWILSSFELIQRRKYNDANLQANLMVGNFAPLLLNTGEQPKSYDDLQLDGSEKFFFEDDENYVDDLSFME